MSWNISLWSKAVLLSVCSRASSSSPTRLWFHIQQITSHTVQMSRISYSGLGKASLQQEGRESASRLPGKNMHFDHISNSGAATKATGRRFYFWQHSKKNWRITPSVSHYCQADLLNLRLRHEGDTENIVFSAQFSVMFHQERQTKLLTNLTRGAHPMDGALSAVVCICSHCLRWATCTPPLPPHPLLQVYWLPREERRKDEQKPKMRHWTPKLMSLLIKLVTSTIKNFPFHFSETTGDARDWISIFASITAS